jgi:hypothetical protein
MARDNEIRQARPGRYAVKTGISAPAQPAPARIAALNKPQSIRGKNLLENLARYRTFFALQATRRMRVAQTSEQISYDYGPGGSQDSEILTDLVGE